MEEAVPWVPYLWAKNITVTGTTVTKFEFDQFSGYLSYTQMAVNNKRDRLLIGSSGRWWGRPSARPHRRPPSERLGEPCGGTSSDGCCGSWSCCWS